MGYTTDFEGAFTVTPPLSPAQTAYLKQFANTRRMRRDPNLTAKRSDPTRLAVGLAVGREGGYFVGEEGFAGQTHAEDVLDYNQPPAGQPELWCKWVPTDDGKQLIWSGMEKFYYYIEWLQYLIDHFLRPWNRTLSGQVEWQGEDRSDIGLILVEGNVIQVKKGRVVYD